MAIYYKCPDTDAPFGGVRVMYRHVDILNRAGLEAYVLHSRPPFRCTWFAHDTPIRYVYDEPLDPPLRDVLTQRDPAAAGRRLARAARGRSRQAATATRRLRPGDALAVSEVISSGDFRLYPGIPRVVFNQGAYQTFIRWSPDDDPYGREDLVGVMTVSEDSEAYLRLAFGDRGRPIVRVHYSVDPARFAGGEPKRKQIAYIPRKNPNDVHQVLSILRLRGALAGWELVALDGLREDDVAAALRASALFLSFGHPEGFGRPPLEALSCGCAVIGYHGLGGREFFRPEIGARAIEAGDVAAFVEAVESFVDGYDAARARHDEVGRAASRFVAETYPPEREAADVERAWAVFLAEARRRQPPAHDAAPGGETATDGSYDRAL